MNSKRRAQIATIFAATVAVVIVPLLANILTGSWNLDRSVLASIGAVVAGLGAVASVFALREREREASPLEEKEQAAFRLIRSFAAMEVIAQEIGRPKTDQDSRRPFSLREVWARMSQLGVWQSSDRIGFDLAVRARNAIVHGDLGAVDLLDLKYAEEKASQLLSQMEDYLASAKPQEKA